ncbi:DUF1833 domain-containing protein [Pseudomonas putida]|uniref:DUF1833 domain-containing protein n=1 Tax=Pseudomonas putida TaxID=303 RepID=A0A2Z4RSC2_PSEPU|nr:DUF1833 family protein [Pseudomonas putida]AWY43862.1 DUF1833 domain-containing protein [Pseudomonas putida]
MSNPINVCYASGGPLPINTIEATCSIWSTPILFCDGYEDRVCGTEDSRVLVFKALALEQALPNQDNSAFQNIILALDNTSGEVQLKVEQAKAANARITLISRRYLEGDFSYPAERYRMSLLSRQYEGVTATLTCGLFDLLGTAFPRDKLNPNVAPGLLYV